VFSYSWLLSAQPSQAGAHRDISRSSLPEAACLSTLSCWLSEVGPNKTWADLHQSRAWPRCRGQAVHLLLLSSKAGYQCFEGARHGVGRTGSTQCSGCCLWESCRRGYRLRKPPVRPDFRAQAPRIGLLHFPAPWLSVAAPWVGLGGALLPRAAQRYLWALQRQRGGWKSQIAEVWKVSLLAWRILPQLDWKRTDWGKISARTKPFLSSPPALKIGTAGARVPVCLPGLGRLPWRAGGREPRAVSWRQGPYRSRGLGALWPSTRPKNEIKAVTAHLPALCRACLLFFPSPLRLSWFLVLSQTPWGWRFGTPRPASPPQRQDPPLPSIAAATAPSPVSLHFFFPCSLPRRRGFSVAERGEAVGPGTRRRGCWAWHLHLVPARRRALRSRFRRTGGGGYLSKKPISRRGLL